LDGQAKDGQIPIPWLKANRRIALIIPERRPNELIDRLHQPSSVLARAVIGRYDNGNLRALFQRIIHLFIFFLKLSE